jgi:phage baseplate assembly protein W
MANDILLDENDDVRIENGDFVIGDSLDQEVGLILRMNKGELKEDPVMGCDLIRLINSNTSEAELKQIIKLQLARDGKSYDELKERIILKTQ